MDAAREWLTTEYGVPDCLIAWDGLSKVFPEYWRMFGSLRGSNQTMGKIGLSLTSPHPQQPPKAAAQHGPSCIKWAHIIPIINKKDDQRIYTKQKWTYIYPLQEKGSHQKSQPTQKQIKPKYQPIPIPIIQFCAEKANSSESLKRRYTPKKVKCQNFLFWHKLSTRRHRCTSSMLVDILPGVQLRPWISNHCRKTISQLTRKLSICAGLYLATAANWANMVCQE